MAKKYTTDEMIKSVRRRASLPASSALFSNEDIVDFLTEELHNVLTPITLDVREEYLVFDKDVDTVIDKSLYQIPSNAVGTGLRKVVLVDTHDEEYDIPFLSIDQKAGHTNAYYNSGGVSPNNYSGQIYHFFQNNSLGIFPTPRTVYPFRMKYYRRPNELVEEKDAATITSLNATSILVSKNLNFSVGDEVEFNQAKSPFSAYGSATITNMPTATSLEFDAVPDGVQRGDWISEENTSPVVNLPLEAVSVLVQSAVVKVLNATGDETQTNQAGVIYEQLKARYTDVISPRGDGSIKKAVGSNNISNYTSGTWGGNGRNY